MNKQESQRGRREKEAAGAILKAATHWRPGRERLVALSRLAVHLQQEVSLSSCYLATRCFFLPSDNSILATGSFLRCSPSLVLFSNRRTQETEKMSSCCLVARTYGRR